MNDVLTDILNHKLSINEVQLDEKQKLAVRLAMIAYKNRGIEEFRAEQEKSVKLEAIKLFPSLWKRDIVLWLRKRSFLKAKKHAQIEANIENRPFYVIRATQIKYVIQSTKAARNLKKRGVYKKDATAIKMQETADYTAYPHDQYVSNLKKQFDVAERLDFDDSIENLKKTTANGQ